MSRPITRVAFVTALLASAVVPLAGAHASLVLNGSFEDGVSIGPSPGYVSLSAPNTSIDHWDVSNGTVDYIGSYWTAADGNRSLDLDGTSEGKISQNITGLNVGTQYRVSFDLAGNPDGLPSTKTLDLTANAGSQSFSFTVPLGTTHTNMGWITESFLFTADLPNVLLSFTSTTAGDYGPALDNVSMAATPLPSTLSLMFIGLAGFGVVCYRRKRQQDFPPAIA